MIRTMRLLRQKHKISYVELNAAAQISTQRLSQIIAGRRAALRALEEDYERYRPQLLDYWAEEEAR